MSTRRDFLKEITAAGLAAAAAPILTRAENARVLGNNAINANDMAVAAAQATSTLSAPGSLIVPKNNGLRITGTFLDEISHDIPHQNWGLKEWDQDFRYMKAMGIDTVIVIRCGYRKFITYPSAYLLKKTVWWELSPAFAAMPSTTPAFSFRWLTSLGSGRDFSVSQYLPFMPRSACERANTSPAPPSLPARQPAAASASFPRSSRLESIITMTSS